jgi:hypothetical protein
MICISAVGYVFGVFFFFEIIHNVLYFSARYNVPEIYTMFCVNSCRLYFSRDYTQYFVFQCEV